MADQLMRDFSIEACSFGVLAACYYYTYSICQVPIGILLDHAGPKRVLRVAIILCSLGTLFFSMAPNFWMAALGRTLIGFGAASAFLGTVRLGTLWFPPDRLAVFVGVTIALGKLGGISANLPLALLIEYFDWRFAMVILAFVGMAIAALVWLFVKDGPADQLPPRTTKGWDDVGPSLIMIMKSPGVWWISIYGCLMYVPLSAFADVWGVSFLMTLHDIDKSTASGAISLLFIGAGVGAPIIALFSDFLRKRQFPMFLSAVFSLIVNGMLIFTPGLSLFTSMVLLFLIGFALTGQTLVFAAATEIMPPYISGTVTGFVNMVVMIGGVILQPLIGWLLDWAWDGVKESGVPIYTLTDYRLALSTIPLCMVVSLIVVYFIPETHLRKRGLAARVDRSFADH